MALSSSENFLESWSVESVSLYLVKLHQFGEIELGLLEDLGLSDHAAVLEWEDLGALGLDLLANLFFEAIE